MRMVRTYGRLTQIYVHMKNAIPKPMSETETEMKRILRGMQSRSKPKTLKMDHAGYRAVVAAAATAASTIANMHFPFRFSLLYSDRLCFALLCFTLC